MRRLSSTFGALCVTVAVTVLGAPAIHAAPGQPDPTFGKNGRTKLPLTLPNTMAVDAKGRTIVSGVFSNDATVARYLPSGKLDKSFGGDGYVSAGFVRRMTVDKAGRLYITEDDDAEVRINRLKANGTLDLSYGGKDGDPNGVALTNATADPDKVRSMTVDSKGRLLIAGYNEAADPLATNFLVIRLKPDGDEDDTFDGNGVQGTDFGGADVAWSVFPDADGNVVVVGNSIVGGVYAGAINVFDETGTDLPSFTGDGLERFAALPAFTDGALGPRGSYLVSGWGGEFTLAAIKPTGELDPRFGGDGTATLPRTGDCPGCSVPFVYDALRRTIYWTIYAEPDGTLVRKVVRLSQSGVSDSRFRPAKWLGKSAAGGEVVEPRGGRLIALTILGTAYNLVRIETAPRCDGQVPSLVGGPGKDKLTGTAKPDVVSGGAGNDTLKGLGGKDRLCGEKGKDTLKGGPGQDKLIGGPGKDKVIQ